MEFKRENRYLVLKRSDVHHALSPLERDILFSIADKIHQCRTKVLEKAELRCVVLESDWPEYEPTWEAIQRRVEGRSTREAELLAEAERLADALSEAEATCGVMIERERRMVFRADYDADMQRMQNEVKRLTVENDKLSQRTCDECSGDGWVYNRVENRGACTCMIEAEPFQILLTALETISKAAAGEIQIANDDTEGMRWIAGKAKEALHSVLPMDYEAPV